MHKHCFINFAFIFCPWPLCILRNYEKRHYQESNTAITIFEIVLEFEKKKKTNVFTYIHLPPYGISFYLRKVLYSKE